MAAIPVAGLVEPLVQDLGKLHAVLLDHSARCEAEAKMLVRELEMRRGDREKQHLNSAAEVLTRTGAYVPAVHKLLEDYIPQVNAQLAAMTAEVQGIKATQAKIEEARNETRKKRQAERVAAAEALVKSMEGRRKEFQDEVGAMEARIAEVAQEIQKTVEAAAAEQVAWLAAHPPDSHPPAVAAAPADDPAAAAADPAPAEPAAPGSPIVHMVPMESLHP